MLNFYTRGGQLALHALHMFKQICMATFLVAFCVGLGVFTILFFSKTTSYQRCLYKEHLHAEFMVNMSQNDPTRITQEFACGQGGRNNIPRRVRSLDVLKNPHILKHMAYVDKTCWQILNQSLWGALFIFVLLLAFFVYRGYITSRKKLERGSQIVSAKRLKKNLQKTDQASDLYLDHLPLAQDKRNLPHPHNRNNKCRKNQLLSYAHASNSSSTQSSHRRGHDRRFCVKILQRRPRSAVKSL